jgi:hypothetical protein
MKGTLGRAARTFDSCWYSGRKSWRGRPTTATATTATPPKNRKQINDMNEDTKK